MNHRAQPKHLLSRRSSRSRSNGEIDPLGGHNRHEQCGGQAGSCSPPSGPNSPTASCSPSSSKTHPNLPLRDANHGVQRSQPPPIAIGAHTDLRARTGPVETIARALELPPRPRASSPCSVSTLSTSRTLSSANVEPPRGPRRARHRPRPFPPHHRDPQAPADAGGAVGLDDLRTNTRTPE
jgi:hypothetical protein